MAKALKLRRLVYLGMGVLAIICTRGGAGRRKGREQAPPPPTHPPANVAEKGTLIITPSMSSVKGDSLVWKED